MKHAIGIAATMIAVSVAAKPFEVLVPVDWSAELPEKHVTELRRMHDEFGLRKFVLIGPWCKRYSCEADVAAYAKTGRDIAFAKKALADLKDVEIGWWLAPSIGSSRDFPGQRMMDCDGNVTFASCPLSREFAAALCERVEACVREARPTVMFVEDDYTLANHGGMNYMKGCFCPLHLAEFARRTGRNLSAKEIAAMFRTPTAENAKERKAFADLSRDSLAQLAAEIRKTIDKVDPSIRVCICQSGFVDVDGASTEAVARAFAGNTRPMIRICGAGYFEETPAKIPRIVAHAIWSAQHFGSDIEMIHETDPYPHTRFYNSSLFLVSELAGAVMGGASGTYYYCTQYIDDPMGDPGYALRLKEYMKRFEIVRDMRAVMKPCGINVVYDPAEVYMYRVSDKGNPFGSLPGGAHFVSKLGFPMQTTADAAASVLFGTAPKGLSDETIAKLLEGGVLIDAEAAVLLAKRGFSGLMGCTAEEMPKDMLHAYEMILPASGCKMRGKKLYNRKIASKPILGWTPKKSVIALLKPVPGAEEWSSLFSIHDEKVAPATLVFRNAKGGTVAVISRSVDVSQAHPSLYSERKQELFMNLFDRLSGGTLDVCAPYTPSTWVLAAKNDKELLVMVENLAGEPRDDIALKFSGKWHGAPVEILRENGSWERIATASARTLLPKAEVMPTVPVFFRVAISQN